MNPAPLPWITASRWTLAFVGVCYLLLGIASGPTPLLRLILEADGAKVPDGVFYAVGAFLFLLGAGIGALNFVVAWGLGRRAKWAWIGGIALGGLYAPSICLPFGAVVLYALLREDARIAYGITSAPRS